MFYTTGTDVGNYSVKSTLFSFSDTGRDEKLIRSAITKIRKKNILDVISKNFNEILKPDGLKNEDISYIATTGEGQLVSFRRGHFYSMTAHARGALYLDRNARSIIDAGALHSKSVIFNQDGRVLKYRMTARCASGTGLLLENISRHLGIAMNEAGELSLKSGNPEPVSNVCSVLAETDIINMISRNIAVENIIKGIYISMGKKFLSLLHGFNISGRVLITGGLGNDTGLISVLNELNDSGIQFCSNENAVFAGSIGAALWGGFRHLKLIDNND